MRAYGEGFVGTVGTYTIAAQALFFLSITAAAFALARGIERGRRIILALGICTRNVGAAIVPLFSAVSIQGRALVMVVLGVPMQIVFALLASYWFARIGTIHESLDTTQHSGQA